MFKLGHISKFFRAGFLIFSLVCASCDFEVGKNVSYKESTVNPYTWLILLIGAVAAIMAY